MSSLSNLAKLSVSSVAFVLVSTLPAWKAAAQSTPVLREYDLSIFFPKEPPPSIRVAPQGNLVFQVPSNDPPRDLPLFGDDVGPPETPKKARRRRHVESEDMVESAFAHYLHAHGALGDEFDPDEGVPSLSLTYSRMLLNAPPAIHRHFKEFSRSMLQTARTHIRVECILVPPATLDKLTPNWRRSAPAVPAGLFEKALADVDTRLLATVARHDEVRTVGSRRQEALITDHEVNQTGVIPVSNPVVEAPFAGDRLQVRPCLLPARSGVVLDISLGRSEVDPQPFQYGAKWSELELPTSSELLLSVTTILKSGQPQLVGVVDGPSGAAVIVRVSVQSPKMPATRTSEPGSGKVNTRSYDIAPLLRTNERRRWWPMIGAEARWWDPEALQELLMDVTGGEVYHEDDKTYLELLHHRLFASVKPQFQRHLDAVLETELRRRTRLAWVEMSVFEVQRGDYGKLLNTADADFVLQDAWREKLGVAEKDVTQYGVLGTVGESHAVRLAKLHELAVGVDNVSGGTGFAIIETADPIIGSCGEGVEYRMLVEASEDPDRVRFTINGADARLTEVRTVAARYPSIGLTEKGDQHFNVVESVSFRLPKQDVRFTKLQREVPIGKDVLLHVDASKGEKVRVMAGRVVRMER